VVYSEYKAKAPGVGGLLLAGSALAQGSLAWSPLPSSASPAIFIYVASTDLASYLVTPPEGNILIHSSVETNVPTTDAVVNSGDFTTSVFRRAAESYAKSLRTNLSFPVQPGNGLVFEGSLRKGRHHPTCH
jgi:hypothetical protein